MRKPHPLFLLLLAATLGGCTFIKLAFAKELKTPKLAYVRTELKAVSLGSAWLDITLKATNPNEVGLENVFVDYELFTEGKRFAQGKGLSLTLAPKGETPIQVPVEVVYKDIWSVLGPTASQLWAGKDSIPVRVDGRMYGTPTLYDEVEEGSLFEFSLKFSRIEKVPVPVRPKAIVKEKIEKALKKLF